MLVGFQLSIFACRGFPQGYPGEVFQTAGGWGQMIPWVEWKMSPRQCQFVPVLWFFLYVDWFESTNQYDPRIPLKATVDGEFKKKPHSLMVKTMVLSCCSVENPSIAVNRTVEQPGCPLTCHWRASTAPSLPGQLSPTSGDLNA